MKMTKGHFTTIVLCCYALFLLLLLTSGSIRKIINPKLSFLSIISLIIIGAMILHNFAKVTGSDGDEKSANSLHNRYCNHQENEHEQSHVHTSYYLLFLPIVLSVLFPPGTIGYQTETGMNASTSNVSVNSIHQKQIVVNPNQSQYVTPSQGTNLSNSVGTLNVNSGNQFNIATQSSDDIQDRLEQFVPAGFREYTQLDIGNTIFNGDKRAKNELTHDKIFLKGKILESKEIPENELILYRMVITCCAADGMPAGVVIKLPLAKTPQESMKFKADEWVAAEGTIQLMPFDKRFKNIDPITVMVPPENIYPVFSATKIYKVQPPRDEYLYP